MQLRADFAVMEAVDLRAVEWVASPMPGVERKLLDRIGDEVARATSVVRYAPLSRFSAHTHDGGEEFLVLEGTFGDEHGRYPRLTYVRNPPGTSHSPIVEDGCVILVKLRQFAADDLTPVCLDTARDAGWQTVAPDRKRLHLHRHGPEVVGLERLGAGAKLERVAQSGGLELFLVEGRLDVAGREHAAWSWFRLPAGATFRARSLAPCLLYVKEGHLPAA